MLTIAGRVEDDGDDDPHCCSSVDAAGAHRTAARHALFAVYGEDRRSGRDVTE